MPWGKAARWIAANGHAGPVASTAPWRRGGRAQHPIDETRELLVDGNVVDPEQIDIWEASDELDTETHQHARNPNDTNDAR